LPEITISDGEVFYPKPTRILTPMQKRRLKQKTLDYIKANEDIGKTFATGNYYQDLHNPESARTDPGRLTRTDPWTDKEVK